MITAVDVVNELMTKVCEAISETREKMEEREKHLKWYNGFYIEEIPSEIMEEFDRQERDRGALAVLEWIEEKLDSIVEQIEAESPDECVHRTKDGICELYSDDEVRQPCVEGPCDYFFRAKKPEKITKEDVEAAGKVSEAIHEAINRKEGEHNDR